MSNKGLFTNGMTTSECDYYFTKGYQQGRAGVIDELRDYMIAHPEGRYFIVMLDEWEKSKENKQ